MWNGSFYIAKIPLVSRLNRAWVQEVLPFLPLEEVVEQPRWKISPDIAQFLGKSLGLPTLSWEILGVEPGREWFGEV